MRKMKETKSLDSDDNLKLAAVEAVVVEVPVVEEVEDKHEVIKRKEYNVEVRVDRKDDSRKNKKIYFPEAIAVTEKVACRHSPGKTESPSKISGMTLVWS